MIFNDLLRRVVESPRSFESVISRSVQNFPDKCFWSVGQFPRALFFFFSFVRETALETASDSFFFFHMKHRVENAPGGFASMAVKRKVRIPTDPGGEVSLVDPPWQEDTPLIISERNFHLLKLTGTRRNALSMSFWQNTRRLLFSPLLFFFTASLKLCKKM